MKNPSHILLKLTVFALCAAVLVLWMALRLPCPIRQLTGIPCPGCGMGRAWLAALRLELSEAFRYHPLFWTVPLVALFVFFDCRLFPKQRQNALFLSLLGLAVAVCYAIRLSAFFRGELTI